MTDTKNRIRELEVENEQLRECIRNAPHDSDCESRLFDRYGYTGEIDEDKCDCYIEDFKATTIRRKVQKGAGE